MEITIRINERTKAGKTLKNLIELFSKENKGVEIVSEGKYYNPQFVAMVKKSAKEKGGKTIKAETLWQDLGL
ncbi:DUF2683 family protein [Pseudopedobacter beijingensis]|uniref:DUF2683 family protein n=1 Tax=Pseudopedobacter beijingensis TaxID=1207056 RepID=A0ABW4IIR8_9SPHI